MLLFLLYQVFPLALAWLAFAGFCRHPARARWAVPAVFLAGAIAQFILWKRSDPDLSNPDSFFFWRVGHGLETDLRTLLYRPKLYPLFLGFFHSPKAAAFAQCLLKLGMAGWIAYAARLLAWRPAATAFSLALFLGANLWLREPLHIYDTTLFSFLFTGAIALGLAAWLRPSAARFAAFCAAAGLCSLCRQVADPFLLACGLLLLWRVIRSRPDAWRLPAACAVGALVLAGSGAIANGLSYGVYARSVALGVNVYTRAIYYELDDPASPEWDFVTARLTGIRDEIPAWRTEWRYDMPWSVNALPHRLERKLGSDGAAEILASDRVLTAHALGWMRGYPGSYLASIGNESARLLCKCEGDYPVPLLAHRAAAERLERGLAYAPLWLMFVAAIAGLVSAGSNRIAMLLPFGAACGYLLLIAALQIGLCRYGLPAWPLLLFPAGQALNSLALRGPFREAPR